MDKSRLIDDTIQVTNINREGKFFEKGILINSKYINSIKN
jgi:hypothetical protein